MTTTKWGMPCPIFFFVGMNLHPFSYLLGFSGLLTVADFWKAWEVTLRRQRLHSSRPHTPRTHYPDSRPCSTLAPHAHTVYHPSDTWTHPYLVLFPDHPCPEPNRLLLPQPCTPLTLSPFPLSGVFLYAIRHKPCGGEAAMWVGGDVWVRSSMPLPAPFPQQESWPPVPPSRSW